ncbi:MAG: BCAM0308 family protein [Sideroxydans sp.]|nr:BCAM0308 family protein [Sideroxydans sp.]
MSKHPPGFKLVRRDQLMQEAVHDSYQSKGKPAEPTRCTGCGAVFHGGRWQWMDAPAGAHETLCPACQRVRDQFPAGFLSLSGDFLAANEAEIRQLISHHEDREKAEHPLQRIMDIEDTADGLMVTTTDMHLARGIGEALHHAYQGELEFHYNPDQALLRVSWSR